MRFLTYGELDGFYFNKAVVNHIYLSSDGFHIILDNVLIKADNPENKDIVDKRTNELDLFIPNGNIHQIVEEGYQVYDADMRPYKKVADRIVPLFEYENVLNDLAESEIDAIEKVDEFYIISMNVIDHTWRIEVSGKDDQESWNRFISL